MFFNDMICVQTTEIAIPIRMVFKYTHLRYKRLVTINRCKIGLTSPGNDISTGHD